MSSSEDEFGSDIENGALEAACAIIPEKSKDLYELAYKQLIDWCEKKKIKNELGCTNEKVVTAYFVEQSKVVKPPTLWCTYSKLKSMIFLRHNVDISNWSTLQVFIKRKNVGYEPKKSNVMSRTHFDKFITEAEDKDNLLLEVAFIIGIGGACRKVEMLKLTTDKVVVDGDRLTIDIEDSKTHDSRQFIITSGSINGMDLLSILRRYIALRPSKATHDRFFLGYRGGKCISQPVGINTFGLMPAKIATILGLKYTETYTGHCFRRSSATILAEGGASLTTIKRVGGWKSSKVAEGYIDNSLSNKRKASYTLFGSRNEAGSSKKHQMVHTTKSMKVRHWLLQKNSTFLETSPQCLSQFSSQIRMSESRWIRMLALCSKTIPTELLMFKHSHRRKLPLQMSLQQILMHRRIR